MKVFVDGAAGTVGMALQPHLQQLTSEGLVELITLEDAARKDLAARREAMRRADLVVLCLPDSEAAAAVALVEEVNSDARILDASAAHRCHFDWVYGLPEVTSAEVIRSARRVANPGCFATACILTARPLVSGHVWSFQGITGYSAGGRKAKSEGTPRLVQFGKPHRHLPEIEMFSGVVPVLTTTVGPWRQGMMVQTFVPWSEGRVLQAYLDAYHGFDDIQVVRAAEVDHRVDPQACNGTNRAQIVVAGQPNCGTVVATVIDNLGKGSAGAAAANIRLMAK